MKFRTKDGVLRMTFSDLKKAENIPYIAVEPTKCWLSTFKHWGKETDAPIVEFEGKRYMVQLTPVE